MEPPLFPTGGPQIVRAAPGTVVSLVLPLPFGSPPIHYKWSRAGASLDDRFVTSDDAGGVRLTVSAARTGDSGIYTLQASNAAGKDTTRVRLEVSPDEAPIGDDPPNFLRRLQDLTVKVGTRTRFLVEIVSCTECKVTWYRNERRLMETERVALVRDGNFWCADVATVSVDDAGRWTCTAENVGGRASCSAHLNVLVPKAYKRPEFVEELRALLTEQGTVSLECKVVGVPTPVLRWFKDSREIKAGDVFALTANADDPTSLGTYTCEAVNCMGRAYSSSKVHVVGRASREGSMCPSSGGLTPDPPPIFTKELEDQFVRICDPLTLNCHIVVPPWPRSVVWYNKEGKIEPSERYHVLEDGVGGYLLEICSTEWADEGEWKCVASTTGGRVGMSACYVSMDVPKNYRKPRFMENLQAVLTEEGLVSFECKVVGFPTPILSWFKDGQELKPGDVYQLTGTNSLGSYCCIAKNCMGQASSSAELTVEDIQNQLNEEEKHQLFSKNQAPKFLQGLKSVEAKIDEPFRFIIKVAVPPEPSLLWYRDDQPVDESTRCHHGKEDRGVFYLDIQNLEFLDQAEWKCIAMNDFGQSVTSCFLKLIIPRHYKKPRFLENLQAILSDEGAVNLECKVIGVPQPVLKWYKDGEELKPGDIHRIISGQDGTCCLGTYTCEAQNCMGIAASSASLLGFDDSMKEKSKKKSEEQTLQRNLSLSTIHEERTSQMYDTPGDRTLDDKGEISFSFDGKEVSVSLYETPDLTEEEALQIVEMYADQLSENVTEHNVVELPPLRFVKETSTSGNLLMEAIIIDVSPEYFASPEEDLRTEADIEDISIADENGPPQISLDHDQEISGQDYLEKTMALLSDEKADIPKKLGRKMSDSQKSGDDYFSLSRDQSLSEGKKDDDTQILSESDLQSFASAKSSAKLKSKSSKPLIEDQVLEIVKATDIKLDTKDVETIITKPDAPILNTKRRSSHSLGRSSSGSEKSLGKIRDEKDIAIEQPAKKLIADEEHKTKINHVSNSLSKILNDIQITERDIILQSELMSSAATASKSLEIIGSLISPLSEIQNVVEAAKEIIIVNPDINSTLFNSIFSPFKMLHQSLTIIEKCIDVEIDNKTLVIKTCISLIEKCGNEIQNLVHDINTLITKNCLGVDEMLVSQIESLSNEMVTIISLSADTIKARRLLDEASEFKPEVTSLDLQHSRNTQKAIFKLKTSLRSLLRIVESTETDNLTDAFEIAKNDIILNDMSVSIQHLQESLEQIESLSIKESTSSLIKYNIEIIEVVMDSILKLRTSFEQLSVEAKKEDNENILKQVLSTVKLNLSEISAHIPIFENKVGKFDILQPENKLEVLQKMAQTLISFENSLSGMDILPDIKENMIILHKHLTSILENVIESNEGGKYFAFLEICDTISRINNSVKTMESHDVFSITSVSNTLKILQDQFVHKVFVPELNCSVLSSIEDIQINLLKNINFAAEVNLKADLDSAQHLQDSKQNKFESNVIIQGIKQSIAAIDHVAREECVTELQIAITPILQSIRPNLENLKENIASLIAHEIEKNEHVSELSEMSVPQSLATPLCQLNHNILVLNQTLLENVESFKSNSEIAATYAQPLHELLTMLEILQHEVVSQHGEYISPNVISSNIANVVDNLQSCVIIIQERCGVETADEMSTLEDVSGIKTTAEIIPSDHQVPLTTEEVYTEQVTDKLKITQPHNVTAKTLQELNEHAIILQDPNTLEFLAVLSECSDYTKLKSVAIKLEELNEGIQEILHPILVENTTEFADILDTSKFMQIAVPMQDLYHSLSVVDASNIPIYENILQIPLDKIHSVIGKLSDFKGHLETCLSTIIPVEGNADKSLSETTSNIDVTKKICVDLKNIIQDSEQNSAVLNPEVSSFKLSLTNFLDAIDQQENIDVTKMKAMVMNLNEKLLIVQDDFIQYKCQPSEKITQEVKLIETVHQLESNIAVLEQYEFVELSGAYDIESCILPQLAQEIQTESLIQMDDLVNQAVNIMQDTELENQTADLMILEDFFKTCKAEFSLLRCLITKRPSHKKVIRLLQEFNFLRYIIVNFKKKQRELSLSEDINELLSNFMFNLDMSMKDIEESLTNVVNSQSKLLFEIPLENLHTNTKKIMYVTNVINSQQYVDFLKIFLQFVKDVSPYFDNLKIAIVEELKSYHMHTEKSTIDESMDLFLNYIEEEMTHLNNEDEYKHIVESIYCCLQKHDCKDIVGQSKALMLLKCLSECTIILKQMLTNEIEQYKQDEEVIELKSILGEMVELLKSLRSQLISIQEKISSSTDEKSISIDITSTESYVRSLIEIHNDVLQLLQSEKTIVDETDLSLIEELDKEIHLIQENIQSAENIVAVDVTKQISLPLETIGNTLTVVKEKMKMEKKTNVPKDKAETLLKHIDQYIEFVEIVEEVSAVIKLEDIVETTNIAKELRESINDVAKSNGKSDAHIEIDTKQELLMHRLHRALSELQVQALDSVFEIAPTLEDDKKQQVIEVVALLKADLMAIIGIQVAAVAPEGVQVITSPIESMVDIKTSKSIPDETLVEKHLDTTDGDTETNFKVENENLNALEEIQTQESYEALKHEVIHEKLHNTPIEDASNFIHEDQINFAVTENVMTKFPTVGTLLEHIDKYISDDIVETVSQLALIRDIKELRRTADKAKALRESIMALEVSPLESVTILQNDDTFNQGESISLLQEALHTLVVLIQHNAQEMKSTIGHENVEHVTEVVQNLYADINALISPDITVIADKSKQFEIENIDISRLQDSDPAIFKQEDFKLFVGETCDATVSAETREHISELIKLNDNDKSISISRVIEAPLFEFKGEEICDENESDAKGAKSSEDSVITIPVQAQIDRITATENTDSMKKLELLLNEINNQVDIYSTVQDTEFLRNTLDEVQTVIIKLKRDFDGSANDTLNETLEDLECSVRSVQLQIDENSAPNLLKDACATLQLLVTNMSDIKDHASHPVVEQTPNMILEKCSEQAKQTIKLLDDAVKADTGGQVIIFVSKLNLLKDTLKMLWMSFRGNTDTLINNGIEVNQRLNQMEEQIFSLEKDIDDAKCKSDVKDSLVVAVHAVYESISNMRSAITSIQKEFMYENYGLPSEKFLCSLKNIAVIYAADNKMDWKHFGKVLRQVLNHFEDIKFYVNFDKTARIPSDATFTKIILDKLTKELKNVVLVNILELKPDMSEMVQKVIKSIEEYNLSLESQSSLEVKEKIPIFKNISELIFFMTDTLVRNMKKDASIFGNQKSVDETATSEQQPILSEVAEVTNISESIISYEHATHMATVGADEDEKILISVTANLLDKSDTITKTPDIRFAYKEDENNTEGKDEVDSGTFLPVEKICIEENKFSVDKCDLSLQKDEIDKENQENTLQIEIFEGTANNSDENMIEIVEAIPSCSFDTYAQSVNEQSFTFEVKTTSSREDQIEILSGEMDQNKEKIFDTELRPKGEKAGETENEMNSGITEIVVAVTKMQESENLSQETEKMGTDNLKYTDKGILITGTESEHEKNEGAQIKSIVKHENVDLEVEHESEIEDDKERLPGQEGKTENQRNVKEQQPSLEQISQETKKKEMEEKGIEKKEDGIKQKEPELIHPEKNKQEVEKNQIEQGVEVNEIKQNENEILCLEKEKNEVEKKQMEDKVIFEKENEFIESKQKAEEIPYLENEKQEATKKQLGDKVIIDKGNYSVEIESKEEEMHCLEKEKQFVEIQQKEEDMLLQEKGKEDAKIKSREEEKLNLEKKKENILFQQKEEKTLQMEKEKEDVEIKRQEEEKLHLPKEKEDAEIKHKEEDILLLEKEKEDPKIKREVQETGSLEKDKENAESKRKEEETLHLEKEKVDSEKKRKEEKIRLEKEIADTKNKREDEETFSLKKEKEDAQIKRREEEKLHFKQEKEDAEKKGKEEENICQEKEKEDAEKKREEEEALSLKKEKEDAEIKRPEEEKFHLQQEKKDAEIKRKEEEKTRLEKEKEDAEKKREEEEALRLKKEKEDAEMKRQDEEMLCLQQKKEDVEKKREEEQIRLEKEKKDAEINRKEEEKLRLQQEKRHAEKKRDEEEATSLKEEKEDATKKWEEEEGLSLKKEKEDAEIKRPEEEKLYLQQEKKDADIKRKEEEKTRLEKEKEDAEKKREEEEALRLKKKKEDAEIKRQEEQILHLQQEKEDAENKRKEEEKTPKEKEKVDAEKKREEEEALSLKKEKEDAEIKRQEEEKLHLQQEKEDAENKRTEAEKTRLEKENEDAEKKREEEEALRLKKEKEDAEMKREEEETLNQKKEKEAAEIKHKDEEMLCLQQKKEDVEKKREEEQIRLEKEKEDAKINRKEEENLRLQQEKKHAEKKREEEEAPSLKKEKDDATKKWEEEEGLSLKKEKEDAEIKRQEEEKLHLQQEKEDAENKSKEEEKTRLEKEKEDAEKKREEEEALRLKKEKEDAEIKRQEEQILHLQQEKEDAENKRKEEEKTRLEKEKEDAEKKREEEEALSLKKEKEDAEIKRQEEEKLHLQQEKEDAENKSKEEEKTRLEKEKEDAEKKREEEEALRLKKEKEDAEMKRQEEQILHLQQEKEDAENKRKEEEKTRLEKEKEDAEKKREEEETLSLKKEKEDAEIKRQEEEKLHLQQEKEDAENKSKEEKKTRLGKEKEDSEKKREEEAALRLKKEKEDAEMKREEEETLNQKKEKEAAEIKHQDKEMLCLQQKKEDVEKKREEEQIRQEKEKEDAEINRKEEEKLRLQREKRHGEKKREEEEATSLKEEKEDATKKWEEEEGLSLKKDKEDAEIKCQEEEKFHLKQEKKDAEIKRKEEEKTRLGKEKEDTEKKREEEEALRLKKEKEDAEMKRQEGQILHFQQEKEDAENKHKEEEKTPKEKEKEDAEKKREEEEALSLKKEKEDAQVKCPEEDKLHLQQEKEDAENKRKEEEKTRLEKEKEDAKKKREEEEALRLKKEKEDAEMKRQEGQILHLQQEKEDAENKHKEEEKTPKEKEKEDAEKKREEEEALSLKKEKEDAEMKREEEETLNQKKEKEAAEIKHQDEEMLCLEQKKEDVEKKREEEQIRLEKEKEDAKINRKEEERLRLQQEKKHAEKKREEKEAPSLKKEKDDATKKWEEEEGLSLKKEKEDAEIKRPEEEKFHLQQEKKDAEIKRKEEEKTRLEKEKEDAEKKREEEEALRLKKEKEDAEMKRQEGQILYLQQEKEDAEKKQEKKETLSLQKEKEDAEIERQQEEMLHLQQEKEDAEKKREKEETLSLEKEKEDAEIKRQQEEILHLQQEKEDAEKKSKEEVKIRLEMEKEDVDKKREKGETLCLEKEKVDAEIKGQEKEKLHSHQEKDDAEKQGKEKEQIRLEKVKEYAKENLEEEETLSLKKEKEDAEKKRKEEEKIRLEIEQEDVEKKREKEETLSLEKEKEDAEIKRQEKEKLHSHQEKDDAEKKGKEEEKIRLEKAKEYVEEKLEEEQTLSLKKEKEDAEKKCKEEEEIRSEMQKEDMEKKRKKEETLSLEKEKEDADIKRQEKEKLHSNQEKDDADKKAKGEEKTRLEKKKEDAEKKQEADEKHSLKKEKENADIKLQEEEKLHLQQEKEVFEKKCKEEEKIRLEKETEEAEINHQQKEKLRLQQEKEDTEKKQKKEDTLSLEKEKEDAEIKRPEEEKLHLQQEKEDAENKRKDEEKIRLEKEKEDAEKKRRKEETLSLEKEKEDAEIKRQDKEKIHLQQKKEDAEKKRKEEETIRLEMDMENAENKREKEKLLSLKKEKDDIEIKRREGKKLHLQQEKDGSEKKRKEEKLRLGKKKEDAETKRKEEETLRLEKEKEHAEKKREEEEKRSLQQEKQDAETRQEEKETRSREKEKEDTEKKYKEEEKLRFEKETENAENKSKEDEMLRLEKENQESVKKRKKQKKDKMRLEKEDEVAKKKPVLEILRLEKKVQEAEKEQHKLELEKEEENSKNKEYEAKLRLENEKQIQEENNLQKGKENALHLEQQKGEVEKKHIALQARLEQGSQEAETKRTKDEDYILLEKEKQEIVKKHVNTEEKKKKFQLGKEKQEIEKQCLVTAKQGMKEKLMYEKVTEKTLQENTTGEHYDIQRKDDSIYKFNGTVDEYKIGEIDASCANEPKHERKEKSYYINYNNNIGLEKYMPPRYVEKRTYENNIFSTLDIDRTRKIPSTYKTQTLLYQSQIRSSTPLYYESGRSSESEEKRSNLRHTSKVHSESKPNVSEKRASVIRDHKRKPVFSTYLTDRTAVEGSRVKLTCSVLSSTDPTITWFKNGVLLGDKLKYKAKFLDGLITLEVLNAVPNDSAEYTCTVQNESGSVSTSANLKVYPSFEPSPIPPTFTRSIRDTYHLAENELVLESRIRGQPLPTITWLKDDRPICDEERYQAYYLADGVCRLVISAPVTTDSGRYTCKAENSMWSDQITHVVNFTGKESCLGPNLATIDRSRFNRQVIESRRPHFTNVLTDYKVTRGGTIGLQVEIKGSPTRVEWLREGNAVTETHRNAQTFVDHGLYTLALSDVTEKESGLYTCRAWSSHGNVDMNAAITVVQPNELEGKPAIIVGRPEKDVLISVGEDLNISFRVQGEPKPKVIFMKGIRDISNSQRVCKMKSDDYVKFTLKRTVVSDAGTYCILARNSYGCDRAFVTVVIRQRASSENLISDWTYTLDDTTVSSGERKYKSVPDRIPGEPSVVDGGNNWVSLAWPKPKHPESVPVLAYKVESWLIGKEGGARWVELGITPLNSFEAFNLKQGEEYHFRVTPRNRYGWGEPVQTSSAIGIGLGGDRPEFTEILPGQLKVLVGQTAKLCCSFKGKPIPEIIWMKNGHEIDDEDVRVKTLLNGCDCSLTIKDVQIEDEARYSCEASNVHGRASTYARMAVITDKLVWEADAKLKRERSAGIEGEYPPQFTMRLRDRRVQATYPVRLTCQLIGNPPPLVTWFKDGLELSYDSRHNQYKDEHFHTLEIAPTTLEDGGVYEAMARNSSGAVSCRCSLVVDKGIRAYVAPEFCCGLEPLYRLCEGEELRISAMVEAYPSVGVTWYRDGVRLRPSRRAIMTLDHDGQIELALASVTRREAGVYTCTASNEVGQASTSGKIEVIGGDHDEVKTRTPPVVIIPDVPYSKEPMFIRKPRSSEAREGDTVIIECEVIGDPKPDVYWLRDFLKPDYYRDANHFKRVGGGPEYRFEIPHAKLDYTGTYSVVARNAHGEAKAIISLQILAKDIDATDDAHNVRYGRVDVMPRFDKDLTDLLCYDGDAIEFECRVSGDPEPYIKWLHYNEVVHDSQDFETCYDEGTARLKIKQVTAEDEGTYTCEAYNNLGKAKTSACLVVYPPGEPNTLSQRLRRPPALLSAASTPRSTPRATPVRSLSRTPGPDPRRLCSPSREIAPKFYTYPFNKVVEEGERVVFKCAVKGLPNPWATWDKDGIIITPTSRITMREKDEILRILEIEEVTIEDVGLYRITLENDYGRAEASARLEVITHKGKFYSGVRSCSASPRRTLYHRRRTPSASRQD